MKHVIHGHRVQHFSYFKYLECLIRLTNLFINQNFSRNETLRNDGRILIIAKLASWTHQRICFRKDFS